MALASKCFSQPILNLILINYSDLSIESPDHVKSFVLFYYYGGMIATAVKNYSRGLQMFEICVTMPCEPQAVSHIMIEAYKKYVLLWLIFHGGDKTDDAMSFPKYTSEVVEKYIKKVCEDFSIYT